MKSTRYRSKMKGTKVRTVGALIFPGFELLDVFGPMEMFGLLEDRYDLHLVAPAIGEVKSAQGLSAHADREIGEPQRYDIVFVPGGRGTRVEIDNTALLDWISKTAQQAEFVLSVCTGSALLAKAGLLNGKRATTNKAAFTWVSEQGPMVEWIPKARWVEDGKFFTSSGVSAGMDMALAAIAAMHGIETSRDVATWSEYGWHEDKDWDPFAEVHGLV